MTTKTTYALLIYRTAPAEPEPSGAARALEQHRALQAQTSASGDLRAVARLDENSVAKTVVLRGGAHELSDGPYIETKEWLVGFYLVDCAGVDEALERARMIATEDHAIEVRPATWAWKRR
jgi:hypothetical protein